jgi:hypothetical protein
VRGRAARAKVCPRCEVTRSISGHDLWRVAVRPIDGATISVFCRLHHIKRLALFGSIPGEDFRPDSDIDVLVEFEPGHVPGLRFVSIERELSEILGGRRVDMATPKILNPRIRDQVQGSAQSLYVAA